VAKEIDRDFDNCDCECDYCGQSETVYSTDYKEINEELRGMGWIIRKIDGEWVEFCCHECFQKYINGGGTE